MTYHIEDYTQDQLPCDCDDEQLELPYDWDSEEAQGTEEELKAEANTMYGALAAGA